MIIYILVTSELDYCNARYVGLPLKIIWKFKMLVIIYKALHRTEADYLRDCLSSFVSPHLVQVPSTKCCLMGLKKHISLFHQLSSGTAPLPPHMTPILSYHMTLLGLSEFNKSNKYIYK